MSKKLFYLLGIAATIFVGTLLYLQFCCNCCMTSKTADDTAIAVKTGEQDRNPFLLNGSGMNYQCNDNFNFISNNSTLITPVSDSVLVGVEQLKTLLIANPKQIITITGYATSEEKNTTKFDNLGLSRANDVRTFFISKGLPKEQFDIKGEIVTSWQMMNDTLSGPVKFAFNELISSDNADVSTIKDELNANPLVLYFNTNKSNENLSKEEHQKISDIAKYIMRTPQASVLIVGHSDSSGKRETNILLAKKRADFAKNYLVKNGISASRIETQSKGPDEPVAENQTAEGKAKNRRTVITIK